MTASSFEWAHNFSSFFWNEEDIDERLKRSLVNAFTAISQAVGEKKVSPRTAAVSAHPATSLLRSAP